MFNVGASWGLASFIASVTAARLLLACILPISPFVTPGEAVLFAEVVFTWRTVGQGPWDARGLDAGTCTGGLPGVSGIVRLVALGFVIVGVDGELGTVFSADESSLCLFDGEGVSPAILRNSS